MKDTIENLRKRYKSFKKGEEDALALKDQVHVALKKARAEGNDETVDELEDMLIDLEVSIQDDKC